MATGSNAIPAGRLIARYPIFCVTSPCLSMRDVGNEMRCVTEPKIVDQAASAEVNVTLDKGRCKE